MLMVRPMMLFGICCKQVQKGKYKVHTIEERSPSLSRSKDFLFKLGRNNKGSWLIDSGATRHVANNKRLYLYLNDDYKINLQLANGRTIQVEGIGSGELKIVDEKSQ